MDSHRHPASLDEVRALLHAQTLPDPLLDSLRELLSSLEQRRGEGHAVPPAHGEPGAEPLAAEERSQGRMLAQLTAGSRAGDRLRAHQLEERARFALSRILSTSAGEDELSLLFEPVGAFPSPRGIMEPTARVGEPDACAGEKLTPGADADAAPTGLPTASPPAWPPAGSPLAAAAGAVDPASAPVAPAFVPSLPGQSDGSLMGFLRMLFAREDLMGLAAAHGSTLQTERTACAEAVLVLLGMPDLLRAVSEGALPYNRLGRLLPKTRLMSLAQLQLLDVFVVGLDRKLSLHRYLSAAQKFISALDGAALTPAQVRRERRVVLERHDDGTGSLTLQGPLLLLEALYQRTRGMARAIMRSQISSLQCELAGNAAGEADGGTAGDDAAREAAAQTPFGSPAHPGGFDPAHVTALDGRGFGQLMFDLLSGALPETTTALLEEDGVRRHHVRLLCPTDGEWLRRQASVNVTVPVTTLLRVDDRPGAIAGASPLPAEFAREIAARSTVWNRILTDPARGTVLDEPSRTYAPDRATRTVVNTKWQTCTAPGCTAPAQTAEFEHAVPFDHCDPARGGPTHPSNGHPMCRRCHVLKTAGIIRMERVGADEIVWSLPLGVTASVIAAPIDAGGALRCASSPPGDSCVRAASENGAASVSGEVPPVMLPGHSKTPRSLGSPGHDDSPGRGSAERGSTVQGSPEHDFPAAGGITAVTTPSQAARLAARVIARMEADEARRESMRRAAAIAEDRALRHTRQEARVLGRREERLTGKLESLRIERSRLAGAQRSHEQSLQRISRDREALDHESLRLERIGESVRRREQRVAQVERAWWERTREAHLRLRAEAAEREAGEWESPEEFMRLLARPGVCPHSDLDAELARMRAEESRQHGSHMLGSHVFGPHVQEMPMQEEAGAPNDAEAPACPRCEAEYAAFLMEISALSRDDIDELLREEEAALRHERERERARETKRQREAFRTAKLRELEATQIREAEAAYRKEGRRLGRERAHSEYAQALSSLCAAQCCVSARATARAADGDSDRHADGTAQAHAPGTGTAGGSRSTEQAGGAPGDSAAPVITAQQPVITEPTRRTAVTRRRRSRFSDDTPPPF